MVSKLSADDYVVFAAMDVPEFPEPPAELPQARLHVSHGYWVAECPAHTPVSPEDEGTVPNCGYAIVACQGLAMVCPEHGWADVIWPPEWRGIEAVLHKRPAAKFANWFPGETVEDLREENRQHGAPV